MAAPVDLKAAQRLMRAQIVAILGDVSGLGRIYGFVRNVQHEAVRTALLKDAGTGALKFWFVSLAEGQTLSQERDGSGDKGTFLYDLHGWHAVQDASESELLFTDVVMDVMTKLNGSQKLRRDGVALTGVNVRDSGPAQLVEETHVMFADALCHRARIQLPVDIGVGTC